MTKKCDICECAYPYVITIDKKKKPLNIPIRKWHDEIYNKYIIATKSVRYICCECLNRIVVNIQDEFGTNRILEDGKNGITFKTFE